MKKIKQHFSCSVDCNYPETLRQKIAHMLIELAAKVDGTRFLFALSMKSSIPIDEAEQRKCITLGITRIRELFQDCVKEKAIESVKEKHAPELYGDRK